MFVLSQDRLAMDLDRDCLELMLSLLESDASHKDALDDCGLSRAELLKNKEKVRQLCADIQAQGHAKHLNLDNITVSAFFKTTIFSLQYCRHFNLYLFFKIGWTTSDGNSSKFDIKAGRRMV